MGAYVTVFDCDYTQESNQAFTADGSYTIGGVAHWIDGHAQMSASPGVINGTGIKITSTGTGGVATWGRISIRLADLGVSWTANIRHRLRVGILLDPSFALPNNDDRLYHGFTPTHTWTPFDAFLGFSRYHFPGSTIIRIAGNQSGGSGNSGVTDTSDTHPQPFVLMQLQEGDAWYWTDKNGNYSMNPDTCDASNGIVIPVGHAVGRSTSAYNQCFGSTSDPQNPFLGTDPYIVLMFFQTGGGTPVEAIIKRVTIQHQDGDVLGLDAAVEEDGGTMSTTQSWNKIKAVMPIISSGVGQTGLTPTVAIQRLSDSKWLAVGGGSWGNSYAENDMDEVDDTNLPGLYEYAVPLARLTYVQGRVGYRVVMTEASLTKLKMDVIYAEESAWDEEIADHEAIDSLGDGLRRMLGLRQENSRIRNTAWNADGKPTTGLVLVYDNAADAAADTSPGWALASGKYAFTATYDASGRLVEYLSTKES